MKKQFFVAAMALVLGAGFTACSSDDLNVKPGTEVNHKATTYMSVSFVLPTANSTRAADDGQDKTPGPDFKYVGKWAGKDDIKKVNVYVFDATGALEANPTYTTAQLSFTQVSTGSAAAKVSANSAFKVKPGAKTVYVVVNPTTAAENLLAPHTTLTAFETAYKSQNLAFAKPIVRTSEYTTGDETRAGELAKVDGGKDVILMTGPAATPTIDDNVSAAEAVSGAKNRADLTVQRAVARVLVTTSATSFTLKGMNPTSMTEEAGAITVSDLTYVVAQGENRFYFLQKDNGGTDGAAFTTPAFASISNYMPGQYFNTAYQAGYKNVAVHYDYSGLWKNTAGTAAKVKGITVPTRAAFDNTAATELGNVTDDLNAALKGEFVLPTLHKYNTDRAQSGYRKGNTAYILVRGYLTPKYVVKADGSVVDGSTLGANDDLYLGANGVFYADQATVQDAANKGVVGQTAQKYVGRKVLYFVWINPDTVDGKAVNSPVIRNNIYHVQIKGISKIGANWNPLVPLPNPGDPKITDPNDPTNPINNNPNNPDPRPDNPLEPKDPPVDPTDPLTSKETWMSVNVNILPWAVHSYEVELSI